MKIQDFKKKKLNGEKITFITCYDYTSAVILDSTKIDCILVGDSVSMTIYGHKTTLPASVELMCSHTKAVSRGIKDKFIVGDLPFLSYRKSTSESMNVVQKIMQSGAQAVKLEGTDGNVELIKHTIESGVPVMGHIGLIPQSVHSLGGFKVQGRNEESSKALIEQAKILEEAGCFAIVLECIPSWLGKEISESIKIPTIGIGAGPHTDGQILVWQDMLGMQKEKLPKFVKQYMNGFEDIKSALNNYHEDVVLGLYPGSTFSYDN